VGIVPNAYVNIGSNSPIALETLLNIDGALKKGMLGAKESEVVKLVVSQNADCDYCLAAHTLIGKKTGLRKEDVLAIRHGTPSSDARLDTLASFTRELISTKGTLSAAAFEKIKSASFRDTKSWRSFSPLPASRSRTCSITSMTLWSIFRQRIKHLGLLRQRTSVRWRFLCSRIFLIARDFTHCTPKSHFV
jgi:AhpD family alkylhydroperoxidase